MDNNKRWKKEEEFALTPRDGYGYGYGYEDVWYRILNYCSLRDCIRMGAVCKAWLSVSKWSIRSRPPQLPWLMMLYNQDEDEGVRCIFSLSDKTMFGIKFPEMCRKRCCGSFDDGWLMIVDDENLNIRLFHPWQRIQLQLPDFRISSLVPSPPYNPFGLDRVKIIKAAISDDRAVVAVILNEGDLAFCRVIDNDKLWTRVRSRDAPSYCDLIYYKGQFYATSLMGGIGVLRINTPNPCVETVVEDETFEVSFRIRTYLLADSTSESLFFCIRHYHILDSTKGFTVYELGLKDKTGEHKENPVEVKSLGDRVIFLGQNSSMLVNASQFPGLKGNCIYFTRFHKCRDLGVFNMEDKTIKVKPFFEDGFHPTFWPPIWIAPPL